MSLIISHPTIGDVKLEEHLPGSPDCNFSNAGGNRVVKKWRVLYGDLWNAVRLLLGFPRLISNGVFSAEIRRVLPHSIKQFPVLRQFGETLPEHGEWLYAAQVQAQAMGPNGLFDLEFETADYEYAILTTTYEALPYDLIPDDRMISGGVVDESTLRRFVTKIYRPTAEYLTLPKGFFKWAQSKSNPPVGDRDPVEIGLPRLTSALEINYTWHQVPIVRNEGGAEITPSGLLTCLGRVNSAEFDSFAPGTLLLVSAESKRYKLAAGYTVYDFNYKMKHFNPTDLDGIPADRPDNEVAGHNYFLRIIPGPPLLHQYHLITSTGASDGRRVYESANFNRLFQLI